MSSLHKKAKRFTKKISKYTPARMVNDALGLGRNNSLRRLADPLEETRTRYSEAGTAGVMESLKSGDLTDPGGLLHTVNPKTTVADGPDQPDLGDATGSVYTSRQRRRRRGVLANLFSGNGLGESNVGRQTLG